MTLSMSSGSPVTFTYAGRFSRHSSRIGSAHCRRDRLPGFCGAWQPSAVSTWAAQPRASISGQRAFSRDELRCAAESHTAHMLELARGAFTSAGTGTRRTDERSGCEESKSEGAHSKGRPFHVVLPSSDVQRLATQGRPSALRGRDGPLTLERSICNVRVPP
jgi:hypothetical protein